MAAASGVKPAARAHPMSALDEFILLWVLLRQFSTDDCIDIGCIAAYENPPIPSYQP